VLLSATADGPVIASVASVLAVPLSQSDGAPETARSTLDVPCVARTRHGTRVSVSKLAFQRPFLSDREVPMTAPVAAFAIVTVAPPLPVPAT
jgi:hypothetical protein